MTGEDDEHFEWIDHTAELELHLEASDPRGVLRAAASALRELLGDADGAHVTRSIDLRETDLPALLAAWIGELAYIAETEGLIPLGVQEAQLTNASLRAQVALARGEPPPLVKAVTYHRLAFEQRDGRWYGSAVLDV